MIPMLLLTIIGAFAFVLLVRLLWAKTQPTKSSTIITVAAAILIVTLALLAATGRLHWIVAVGAAVFPFLRRLLFFSLPFLRHVPVLRGLFGGLAGAAAGAAAGAGRGTNGAGPQASEVATSELRMTLHHESGHMDGEILKGAHRGRLLSELSRAELDALLAALEEQQSKQLLQAYMKRHFGEAEYGDEQQSGDRGGFVDGNMTAGEALEVLGLTDGATKQEIIDAHRRLIQRMHPDRGGSSYLAAKLNEAKRVLTEDRK